MKLKHLALAACMAALPQLGMAEDAHHPDQAKPAPAMGSMMGPMQEHMKRMQDEMAGIRAAKDPKEKERLMDEHMKTMESSMAMMRKMMEGGKMMHGGGH
jgi:hypothetical protein